MTVWNDPTMHDVLPDAYQQVEYIESTGTQWVNTGILCKDAFKTEVDAAFTGFKSGGNRIEGFFYYNGSQCWSYGWEPLSSFGCFSYPKILTPQSTAYKWTSSGVANDTERHLFVRDFIDKTYRLDDMEFDAGVGFTAPTESIYSPLLCVHDIYGAVIYNTYKQVESKLYSAKYYNSSNALVRDFVPCRRRSDGAVGLYDLVSGRFFGNSGTGSFLKGPDA